MLWTTWSRCKRMERSRTGGAILPAAAVPRVVVFQCWVLSSLCPLRSKQCRWLLRLALHSPRTWRPVPACARLAYMMVRSVASATLTTKCLLPLQQCFKCQRLQLRQPQRRVLLLHPNLPLQQRRWARLISRRSRKGRLLMLPPCRCVHKALFRLLVSHLLPPPSMPHMAHRHMPPHPAQCRPFLACRPSAPEPCMTRVLSLARILPMPRRPAWPVVFRCLFRCQRPASVEPRLSWRWRCTRG